MQGNAGRPFQGQDVTSRIMAVRYARDHWLWAGCVKLMGALPAAFQAGRKRRKLASLSDSQLSDAGIDRTVAGRGKAAAAQLDPNLAGLR